MSISNQSSDNHHHHHQYLDNSQMVASSSSTVSEPHSSREPKITASISNIGGAVLRSKTADFERLLKQNNKRQQAKSSSGGGGGGGGGEESLDSTVSTSHGPSSQMSDASKVPDASETEHKMDKRSQPIYKRKEIISSVQSPNK